MIDHAVLSHQADALNETCVVTTTAAHPASDTPGRYGVETHAASASSVTLRCLYLPSRRSYDRELGVMITVPARLLIEGPISLLSAAATVTFRGERFRPAHVTTDAEHANLTLVTLEAN